MNSDEHRTSDHENDPARLLGAWALDAVSAAEEREVAELIARDPEAAREARELRETAALLARTAPQRPPDPAVRDAILRRVQNTRQLPPEESRDNEQVVSLDAFRRVRRLARVLGGVAAALALIAAVTTGLWWNASRPTEASHEEQAMATIMSAHDARVEMVDSGTVTVQLTYAMSMDTMIVRTDAMPTAEPGMGYQMWLMDNRGDSVSAGMLADTDEKSVVSMPMNDMHMFVVTLEPASGSPRPTSEPLLMSELA